MSKKLRDWNQFKQQEASDRFSSEQQSLKIIRVEILWTVEVPRNSSKSEQ
jgi:hypothetical protein